MTITGFSHWTLAVTDLERSTAFYRDVMGWQLVGTDEHARRFVRDGQRVELRSTAKGTSTPAAAPAVNHLGLSHITVATGPAPAVLASLHRLARVKVRDHTRSSFTPGMEQAGTQFLFEDPDGNIIETYAAEDDWNAFGVGDSDPARSNDVGIAHLSHWSLCVADPARSLPFYRDVMGWKECAVIEWEGEGPSIVMDVGPARLTTWLLAAGDQRIEIIHFTEPPVIARPGSGATGTGLAHMTVTVDDVAEGDVVELRDPDGNLIRGVASAPSWA